MRKITELEYYVALNAYHSFCEIFETICSQRVFFEAHRMDGEYYLRVTHFKHPAYHNISCSAEILRDMKQEDKFWSKDHYMTESLQELMTHANDLMARLVIN